MKAMIITSEKSIYLFCAAVCLMLMACEPETVSTKKPNIVIVFADDQRGKTIHALGNDEIITPNLDTLVSEGLSFANAFIMGSHSGAVCQPSRIMLLAGKYLNNLKRNGYIIPESDSLIGESLVKAGYNTFGIGKYHSAPESYTRAFSDGKDIFFGGMHDQWNVPLNSYASLENYEPNQRPVIDDFFYSKEMTYEKGEYMYGGKHSTDIFTQAAVEYIRNYDSDKPFFIYTALMTPHDPRTTHQKYFDLYDTFAISLPPNFLPQHPFDNGEMKVRDEMLAPFPRTPQIVKEHLRDYYALITHNDDRLGDIIAVLKEEGMYENTIIIYSGDNGLAVGQHGLFGKQNLYEHSINIPLILRGKGIPVNQRSEAFVYLTDLYPTICEMLGISIPPSVDGTSFYDLLQDPGKSHHEYITTTYKSYQRAIRDVQYKLIKYHVNDERQTQLFDLINDPYEITDLSENTDYQDEILRLEAKLAEQLKLFNDTLWVE
jgi:arylsulfatase A-like enzyme